MPSSDGLRAVPRIDVLGVGVSAINMDDALEVIDSWITEGMRRYVCITGVHGIMESQRDEALRQVHNAAGLVTPDGMPLVWLGRWRGLHRTNRVYGPDLMLAVCERSLATGYRHFFYGGVDGVPERLAERMEKRYPGLAVAGTYSPPFRPIAEGESEEMICRINDSKPDIVWVGLGTPKQEHWMAQHVNRLTASVLIGVGAAFDLHAGLRRQAPRWVQQGGLEWVFRLGQEPRRLWRRYLINNPLFVWLTLLQMVRATPAPADGEAIPHTAAGTQPDRKVS